MTILKPLAVSRGRLRYLLGARTEPVLYLHVGMHKTGTTAIQAAMYASRRQLARRGIYYPEFEQNHSVAIGSLFSKEPEKIIQNMRRGRTSTEQFAEYNADIAARLRRMCSMESWEKLLISGEKISTLGADGVGRLKQFFDGLVADYRIIFYIRSPVSFINSAAQERIKGGSNLADLVERPPLPRYRERLEPFVDHFGRAALELRLYRRGASGEGVLQDFCRALGEPALAAQIKAGSRNRSWSANAVRVMDAYNTRYPLVVHNGGGARRLNPERPPDGVLRNVLQYLSGPSFALDSGLLDTLRAQCSADIEWMETLYGAGISDESRPGEPSSKPVDAAFSSGVIDDVVDELHALCSQVRSDPEAVGSICNTLLRRFPANPELWFQRGGALARCADPAAAEAALHKAIEFDPEHFRAWHQLAIFRQVRGDLRGARAAALQSVSLSPETDAFRARLKLINRQTWAGLPINLLTRARRLWSAAAAS